MNPSDPDETVLVLRSPEGTAALTFETADNAVRLTLAGEDGPVELLDLILQGGRLLVHGEGDDIRVLPVRPASPAERDAAERRQTADAVSHVLGKVSDADRNRVRVTLRDAGLLWNCPECHFDNAVDDDACAECDHPRPS